MAGILRKGLLAIGLFAMVVTASARNGNGSYISNHKAIAILLSHRYGIPASLILAVATVESSGGKGPAARVLNNHFGMEGRNCYCTKSGFTSRYKQYDNVFASYLDFCQLLTRKRFYRKLKNNKDCTAWVKAMSQAHYSEVPEEWEQKVMGVLAVIKSQSRKEPSTLLAIR